MILGPQKFLIANVKLQNSFICGRMYGYIYIDIFSVQLTVRGSLRLSPIREKIHSKLVFVGLAQALPKNVLL